MWELRDVDLLCEKLSKIPPKSKQLITERFKMQREKVFVCNSHISYYHVFKNNLMDLLNKIRNKISEIEI